MPPPFFSIAGRLSTDGLVEVAALRDFAMRGAPDASQRSLTSSEDWAETAAFTEAVLAGDARGAMVLVNSCMARGDSLVAVEVHVMQPALYRIGVLWQENKLSMVQEHLATAVVQSVMTSALLRTSAPAAIGRRVVLAAVAGNQHLLGLRMVADAFQLAGWDVDYLGANVPTTMLVEQVAASAPDLLGLSVAFAHQLPEVNATLAQLRARCGDATPPVLIGGVAIRQFELLARSLGASAFGLDADAAVAEASRLVAARPARA